MPLAASQRPTSGSSLSSGTRALLRVAAMRSTISSFPVLHQVRHAATFAPVVDEGGHVAVREVGIAWEDATTPIATEDIEQSGTGHSLGGCQPRHIAGAQLPFGAVKVRSEERPF